MVLNFYNLQCFLVILFLLLQAGDVETNPDPENVHELSILKLNIRSIRNKLDFILDNFSDFNILCFSETHLDAQQTCICWPHMGRIWAFVQLKSYMGPI